MLAVVPEQFETPDPGVLLDRSVQYSRTAVGTPIIDQDHLVFFDYRTEYRIQPGEQQGQALFGVVDRNDYGNRVYRSRGPRHR